MDAEDGETDIEVKTGIAMMYVADAIVLGVEPVFHAPAFIVVLVEIEIGLVYTGELSDGVVPSRV